jgi:formylmethanofuran dehydrogenase subunit D|tara:strand:+ start:3925 stop:4128 length:204 start_codon:yes stop_codon:yes gene_type:complete
MSDEPIKIPAITKEIVKNKRTGKVYDSKADFDNDVADPNTDTTSDDFQQDLQVTVASLHTKGETIPD